MLDILDKIGPYHMFNIIRRNVTLKIDRTWEVSLFSCYWNSIISTLLRIQNLITLNKPIKFCCYFKEVKKNYSLQSLMWIDNEF